MMCWRQNFSFLQMTTFQSLQSSQLRTLRPGKMLLLKAKLQKIYMRLHTLNPQKMHVQRGDSWIHFYWFAMKIPCASTPQNLWFRSLSISLLQSFVVLMFSSNLIVKLTQGNRKTSRKVKHAKPCCWTSTLRKDGKVSGLVVLYQTGDLDIR